MNRCNLWIATTALTTVLMCGPCSAAPARSHDPDITLSARETADTWRNLSGGVAVGWTTLNKLQVSATWTANALDDPGFRIHAQVFRTNGERLTSHTGDLQTVSNIEAVSTDRLFEAWAEQTFGKDGAGGWAVRAGLIDFNSDFDSIDPASLFIDSSHGIGPDISKSGRNGPSIFPVSAAAVRITWTPTEDWTVRGGVFDGVPGDPEHPKAFAALRLSADDGVLSVLQIDRKLSKDAQVSVGTWGYNRGVPRLDGTGSRADAGVYGFVEGPVPRLEGWTGWVRVLRVPSPTAPDSLSPWQRTVPSAARAHRSLPALQPALSDSWTAPVQAGTRTGRVVGARPPRLPQHQTAPSRARAHE